jgi:hypothetical protein
MQTTAPSAAARSASAEPPARLDVSGVLPCLDEEGSVGAVVDEALAGLARAGLRGEVIVVDNGSRDRSAEVARGRGARVVHEQRRGYGSAYLAGFEAARGDVIVLADADGTYPLDDLAALLAPLREGADVVLGSRLNRQMEPGAMPWKNRWLGNPLLTGLLNVLFRARVSDAHSGLRAMRRSALSDLDLQTTGMEFASEMIVKAAKRGLRLAEVPIAYRSREGSSKLSPYRDGWRHIRYMLTQSPTGLFLLPGGLLFALGMVAMLVLAGGPVAAFGRRWEIHAMIVASVLTLVGSQVVQLGLFARTYAFLFLDERDSLLEAGWRRIRLEHGLVAGMIVLLSGLAILGTIVGIWVANGFGTLHQEHLSVLALTLIWVGVQIVFGSFFLSILPLGARSTAR